MPRSRSASLRWRRRREDALLVLRVALTALAALHYLADVCGVAHVP